MILSNCQETSCITLEPANQTRRMFTSILSGAKSNKFSSYLRNFCIHTWKDLKRTLTSKRINSQRIKSSWTSPSSMVSLRFMELLRTKARKNLRCNFFFDPSGVRLWCSDITLSQNVIRPHLACLVSAIQSIDHQGHIWSKLASSYKKKRKGELRTRRYRWTRGQSLRTSQAEEDRKIREGLVGNIPW